MCPEGARSSVAQALLTTLRVHGQNDAINAMFETNSGHPPPLLQPDGSSEISLPAPRSLHIGAGAS